MDALNERLTPDHTFICASIVSLIYSDFGGKLRPGKEWRNGRDKLAIDDDHEYNWRMCFYQELSRS